MIEQWFWHHRVCLVKTHRNMYIMILKGQGQNLTSGRGHVVTQVCHFAYVSMRLDKRNTMMAPSRLYLFWIKSYSQKTVGDIMWPQMTFGGSPMKTVAWVITEDLSQHHSQWMKMFRCEKEVVEILPFDLTRHRLGGVGSDPPPLGFSGITSSFITVSTWHLAHLSGHQFGVVSCK